MGINRSNKFFIKTFEKPLDKPKVLWYNISVRKRGNQYVLRYTKRDFEKEEPMGCC